ncbi:hypothetical protein DKX38_025531 [Salix brachista]|uniref:DUF4408 domain-containing protein n=1 Tax=Salix brachista TaxID=2182728 RepID=A0A5N5JPZ6_9ROSI|nr:hypothetical protein DKX38_025531 [Salix brachista]
MRRASWVLTHQPRNQHHHHPKILLLQKIKKKKKKMDEAKLPSLQAPSKLKKITQLLLSVSVFSLLLSHRSLGPSLLHSLCFYLSTVPVQLITHTLDKNCIFLLCNGLLVFVAKYSGFISSSSTTPATDDRQSFSKYEDPAPESKMPEDGSGLVESIAPQEDIAVTKEDEFMSGGSHGRTEDREIEELIGEDEDEKDGGKGDGEPGFLITWKEGDHESELSFQEHEEVELLNDDQEFHTATQEDQAGYYDDGEGNGVLIHDLNKKFEEFIRKTKEEIRIEAQLQYLVMAN